MRLCRCRVVDERLSCLQPLAPVTPEEERHIDVYLARCYISVYRCTTSCFVPPLAKDSLGTTSGICGIASDARGTEGGVTRATRIKRQGTHWRHKGPDLIAPDKDALEEIVNDNTGPFHLQARVFCFLRIATLTSTTISTTISTTTPTSNHHQHPFPAPFPSDMVVACDRSGVAIAIVKTLQDRVT